MLINTKHQVFLLSIVVLINSCIVEYFPKIVEEKEMLVVEGLITDQPGTNTFRLSKTLPLGKLYAKPLKGCKVSISDDLGHIFNLKETRDGTYVTDSANFKGVIGRQYTLHIRTTKDSVNYSYESFPMEMKPVPPIDSIYYEKKIFVKWPLDYEGCQIYLDTHDPSDNCKFYRWEFTETWEFHLPYNVVNRVCWISDNSKDIYIKNTALLAEDRIIKYPVYTITDPIDRLKIKYSILIRQFSLNEDEYLYWDRLKNLVEQGGGLYDIIPSTIQNNIFCVENPKLRVCGYFSVSAVSSKRIFIQDSFAGMNLSYMNCSTDTIFGTGAIPGLNITTWVIVNNLDSVPPNRIITNNIDCADCRVRGTNIRPAFWNEGK
jgi:hypothetical protein